MQRQIYSNADYMVTTIRSHAMLITICLRLSTCIWFNSIQHDNNQKLYYSSNNPFTVSKLTSCRHFSLSLETRNKLVSNSLNAVLESLRTAGVPLGRGARHSSLSREPDVKNVFRIMAIVSIEVLIREAHISQRNGGLSNGGLAVGIAPDAIELPSRVSFIPKALSSNTTMEWLHLRLGCCTQQP